GARPAARAAAAIAGRSRRRPPAPGTRIASPRPRRCTLLGFAERPRVGDALRLRRLGLGLAKLDPLVALVREVRAHRFRSVEDVPRPPRLLLQLEVVVHRGGALLRRRPAVARHEGPILGWTTAGHRARDEDHERRPFHWTSPYRYRFAAARKAEAA